MQTPSFALLVAIAIALSIAACLNVYFALEPSCSLKSVQDTIKSAGSISCFEHWLYRYQGLLGGILALLGASITVAVMRWQTMAGQRYRRRLAHYRALAELRLFRSNITMMADDIMKRRLGLPGMEGRFPKLRFASDPDLIADLDQVDADHLIAFANFVSAPWYFDKFILKMRDGIPRMDEIVGRLLDLADTVKALSIQIEIKLWGRSSIRDVQEEVAEMLRR